MLSLEESRKQVKAGLERQAKEIDDDDIFASLHDEIDRHQVIKDERHRKDEQTMRFRFKRSTSDPKKRKQRSRQRQDPDTWDEHRHQRKRRKRSYATLSDGHETAHPLPREPVDTKASHLNSADAFRESLFDALADDEGAQYWENVYSQPIHVYPRPSIEGERGELEQMDDEEYAAYVKMKMWEKKNPHLVLERERAQRKRMEQEQEQSRQREDFVRRKEQAAWDRAQKRRARSYKHESECEDHEYIFSGEKPGVRETEGHGREIEEDAAAWSRYLQAWDKLKVDLLQDRTDKDTGTMDLAKRIPWPVLGSNPVIKANIEAFLRHAPAGPGHSNLHLLKIERVRWHPDKVQQRFRGKVGDVTMKVVTSVFQVVDGMFEEARRMASVNG